MKMTTLRGDREKAVRRRIVVELEVFVEPAYAEVAEGMAMRAAVEGLSLEAWSCPLGFTVLDARVGSEALAAGETLRAVG